MVYHIDVVGHGRERFAVVLVGDLHRPVVTHSERSLWVIGDQFEAVEIHHSTLSH